VPFARSKAKGYRLEMVYLHIESPQLARRRIAARVKQGGGMMFRSKTSNDDSRAVGGISSHSTVPWPIV
jgi:predicted ABC-type ATPase